MEIGKQDCEPVVHEQAESWIFPGNDGKPQWQDHSHRWARIHLLLDNNGNYGNGRYGNGNDGKPQWQNNSHRWARIHLLL